MNHSLKLAPAAWPRVLCAAVLAVLAGCGGGGGGGDVVATPVSNGGPTGEQIAAAQAAIESPIVAVSAGSSALTATQIDSQRAALDGNTTDGSATIAANQTALDVSSDLAPAF